MILWVKTFHVLFVMAWMAGVFYMPRILVHYVEGTRESEDTRRLVTMAERLFKFSCVMATLAIIGGLALWMGYGITGGWLHAKLVLVAGLLAYQFKTWQYIQKMRAGDTLRTSLFFRLYNESALLFVVPILILVIVKPF